jgi:hypothetical protein
VRRARVWIPLAFAVFVFVGISALLARGLTGSGNERAKVIDLLHAQARGDAAGVLALLPACRAEPACASSTSARVEHSRVTGPIEILNYAPSARLALTNQVGTARVAWRAGTRLPVVQCVRVRREGPLSGATVELLSISAPIAREGSCAP